MSEAITLKTIALALGLAAISLPAVAQSNDLSAGSTEGPGSSASNLRDNPALWSGRYGAARVELAG